MHHTADQFEHISKTTWARTIEILTASPAGPIRGYYDRVCLLFIYYYWMVKISQIRKTTIKHQDNTCSALDHVINEGHLLLFSRCNTRSKPSALLFR